MSRVLVVDDEPQILRALGINLRARGYEVDLAPDGERALDVAARHHPDVVVLDLGLPGMKINTGPNDYRVNKQLQMMKFNGERWEMFGPILEDKGAAG